jgi:hypothetical protein
MYQPIEKYGLIHWRVELIRRNAIETESKSHLCDNGRKTANNLFGITFAFGLQREKGACRCIGIGASGKNDNLENL